MRRNVSGWGCIEGLSRCHLDLCGNAALSAGSVYVDCGAVAPMTEASDVTADCELRRLAFIDGRRKSGVLRRYLAVHDIFAVAEHGRMLSDAPDPVPLTVPPSAKPNNPLWADCLGPQADADKRAVAPSLLGPIARSRKCGAFS